SFDPAGHRLQLTSATVEAPHSHVTATGGANWQQEFSPALELTSQIGLEDVVPRPRAFPPGTDGGLRVEGMRAAHASLVDWPLRIDGLTIDSPGASLYLRPASAPARFGAMKTSFQRGVLASNPIVITLPGMNTKPGGRGLRAVGEVPSP